MLKLRALETTDLDTLYQWENDTSLWDVNGYTTPFSKEALGQFIEASSRAESIFSTRQLRQIIELNEQAIGCVDLFEFDPRHKRAGVGILIYDRSNRGKGYAKMALSQTVEYAQNILGIDNIWAHVPTTNIASVKLFENSGFVHTGTMMQWQRFGNQVFDVAIYQKINK